MSSPLEKFILENREKFDADAPDPRVWEKINEKLNPDDEKVKPMGSIPFKRWLAAAAAVVLLASTAVMYFTLHNRTPPAGIAGTKTVTETPANHLPVIASPADSPIQNVNNTAGIPEKAIRQSQIQSAPDMTDKNSGENAENKEMYYYAKLIEIKHEELKTLEKDEPLLYRQFSGDVQKLDGVYHSLKTQLPNTSNREQVMEAMISNLQLQIGLLNRQLKIIKQIKNSKKSAYEKAYKSV